MFEQMSALQAAALYSALLLAILFGLKCFVGARRGQLKVLSGDVSNPEFARTQRVQQNAVEDVPVLLLALVASAMLGAAPWLIHAVGIMLVASRLAHAVGLAAKDGFSIGRFAGTLGTMISYLTLVIVLLQRAFDASGGSA